MMPTSLPIARIPVATYRLQFNRHFTFAQAREIIPYLHLLGISDIYASPYFTAREGSLHGYDIVDPTTLNDEVGTEAEYALLVDELRRFDMGQILDFVPNHMCIECSRNSWWFDILENGPCSRFAAFFDINWHPVQKELENRVLLPLLGDQYGTTLEKGELQLAFRDGAFFIHYYETKLPVEPRSSLLVLRHRQEVAESFFAAGDDVYREFLSVMTALEHLPAVTSADPENCEERDREKEIVKKRLRQLTERSSVIADFIRDNVLIFNGVRGESRSFDLLDRLLCEQVYRLAFWRVATEEINYRRFFDINGLGAIRMEDPAVFRETHRLLFRLIREKKISGVRLDHLDGLFDPLSYLHRLQQECFLALTAPDGGDVSADGGEAESAERSRVFEEHLGEDPAYKPFYVVGEKILLKGERLPEEWPVHGTTGYDFLSSLNNLFVDTENAKEFDRLYTRILRQQVNFQEIVYDKKKLAMQVTMSGEINTLGHYLRRLSEQDRLTRDFTLNSLTRSITEVIACFPVYRTYINSTSIREKDTQYIETAIARAKRKNPVLSVSMFDFLRDVLLLRVPDYLVADYRQEWLDFVMKFQQLTGPVMAKGFEDTACYVYNRLVSLNDVGEAPDRFGISRETFHGQNRERLKSYPQGMITSATHDSKRGEDVRARINVLSEMPAKWWKALISWSRINRGKKRIVDGQPVPDRNEEYLLYQTLIGAWPAEAMDQAATGAFVGRIREYMVKAIREAKVNTSWINPNSPYEEAMTAFIDGILTDDAANRFLQEFRPFQTLVSHYGYFTSLSQTLLKIASPGIPDFYQGTELWDLHLVDPDNRRPIDFRSRVDTLTALKQREEEVGKEELVRELTLRKEDGRIKLYLIHAALTFRRDNRYLFEKGEYLPLEAGGERVRNVVAFARREGGATVVVAVPRFMATLMSEVTTAPCNEEVWLDSYLAAPDGSEESYLNILTGRRVPVVERDGARALPLADVFAGTPVALLQSAGDIKAGEEPLER